MATPQDEILYRASIIDETIEFFERFDRNLARQARATEQGFDQVDRSIKQTGVGIGVLSGLISAGTTALLGFAQQGISQLKQLVSTSIAVAARVDTLGVSVQTIGRNFGYTTEQLAEFEEGIKTMGITTQGARQIMLNMMQANLDLSKATELARVAQDAAVITGQNSTDTFNRMLYSITRLDTMMLRNMGIVVDLQSEYAKVAAETGRSAESISTVERQTIALNAVLAKGQEIAGTYEAALGTAGKQLGSMARLVEEVQLSIGAAFQPAYAEAIGYMSNKLKELQTWFDANEEALAELGERAAKVITILFDLFDRLLSFVGKLPGTIEKIGLGIADTIARIATDGERRINQSNTNVLNTMAQLLTLWGAFLQSMLQSAEEVIGLLADLVEFTWNTLSGKPREFLNAEADAIEERISGMIGRINDRFDTAFQNGAEFFGLIEDGADDSADAVEEMTDSVVGDAATLEDALKQVEAAMKDLKERMEEAAELRAIRDVRQELEDALRLSHQLEDIELAHKRRLKSIRESFDEQRQGQIDRAGERALALEEQQNESRLAMERDFQRRLRDMRQRFDFEASELARQRDAVGLLRLARNYGHEVSVETQRQEERRQDAEASYQKQLRELQESLAKETTALEENLNKQLDAARKARREDEENLKRSLKRQEEFRVLHRQFEDEDRQRAFDKEQRDLAEQFSTIEGLTEDGLASALGAWEDYFGDLTTLIAEYSEIIADMMEAQSQFETPSEERGGRRRPSGGGRSRGGRGQAGEGGVIGQAGQVSSMLANNPISTSWRVPNMMSQVPVVNRSSNVDRREIIVKVEAHDPYLQRQITNTIYEIERNRK